MDDPLAVRLAERIRDLDGEVEQLLDAQRPGGETLVQRLLPRRTPCR
ncbi:MAG: hypothetical protein V1750_10985 [Acidobacteriota bacterium]